METRSGLRGIGVLSIALAAGCSDKSKAKQDAGAIAAKARGSRCA